MNRAVPNCFGLDYYYLEIENRIERPPIAKIFFSAPVFSHCKIWIIFLNDLFGQHYTLLKTFLWTFDSTPQHSNKNPKKFLCFFKFYCYFVPILAKFLLWTQRLQPAQTYRICN